MSTDTTPEAFDHLIGVDLKSMHLCAAATSRGMREQGAGVVDIASQTGIAVLDNGKLAISGAAKAGVAYLTRALATELGLHGIRVNAIAPGIIETHQITNVDPTIGVATPEQIEAIALRRFGQTDDMANVLEFLTIDLSSYVTGQVISACGGAVLHPN